MTLDFKGNEKVRDEFLHWLLVDKEHGVIKFAKNKKVIQDVADLYKRKINGGEVTKEEWEVARYAADDYADDYAADAAYYATSCYDAACYDTTAYAADAAASASYGPAAARKAQQKKLDELHALYGGDDDIRF